MGRLELRVRDMDTQLEYYTKGLGLTPLADEPGAVTLGLSETPVVRLSEAKDLRAAPRGSAGLFHTALVFDTEAQLAGVLANMAQHYGSSFF